MDIFAKVLAMQGNSMMWAPLALLAAFVAGLLACATPCVYPMIPITVSVFGAKQAKSRWHAIALSGSFVGGIAVLYTVLGLVVFETKAVWGSWLSSSWVSVGISLLFAALAASMFGAFELELPGSMQNRLSNVGGAGYRGSFLLGLVMGLIASPCTTAPFASILGSFQGFGPFFGSLSVLAFSLGLGAPFFFVGAFAARLPKSGKWMHAVKSVFGVALVVIALGYLRVAIAPLTRLQLTLAPHWLILLVALTAGLAIGAIHLKFGASLFETARKSIGVLAVSIACFGLVGTFFGGASRDAAANTQQKVDWQTNADKALSAAKAAQKPVFIDFGAEWCTSCRELEEDFASREFVSEVGRFVPVRVDGTHYDEQFTRYSDKFQIDGLPVMVILNSRGDVAKIFRSRVPLDQILSAMRAVN